MGAGLANMLDAKTRAVGGWKILANLLAETTRFLDRTFRRRH